MTYEITFKPARGRKGPEMAYIIDAACALDAAGIARRYVDVEAPGYMLAGYREITPPALSNEEMAELIAADEAADRREAVWEASKELADRNREGV
jgi:hypothetical protein